MQFLVYGALVNNNISEKSQVNYSMNALLHGLCIPVKEKLHMVFKAGGHLANRSLGNWKSFLPSPISSTRNNSQDFRTNSALVRKSLDLLRVASFPRGPGDLNWPLVKTAIR